MNAVRYITFVHTKVIFPTDIYTLNSLLQQHKNILLHAPTVSDVHIDISLILRPLKSLLRKPNPSHTPERPMQIG